MKVRTMWVQVKGKDVPEMVSAVDEYTDDDNPSWYVQDVEKQKSAYGSEALAWAEIVFDVPDTVFDKAFAPTVVAVLPATNKDGENSATLV
jgi:hypothetical protein